MNSQEDRHSVRQTDRQTDMDRQTERTREQIKCCCKMGFLVIFGGGRNSWFLVRLSWCVCAKIEFYRSNQFYLYSAIKINVIHWQWKRRTKPKARRESDLVFTKFDEEFPVSVHRTTARIKRIKTASGFPTEQRNDGMTERLNHGTMERHNYRTTERSH